MRLTFFSFILLVLLISGCEKHENPDHWLIFIPSAFSPVVDGINDIFHPIGAGLLDVVEYKMTITDLEGHNLYSTTQLYDGWNGHNDKGEIYPPGLYIYYMWFKFTDGIVEKYTGTVEITQYGW